jgi:cell division protein FtsL
MAPLGILAILLIGATVATVLLEQVVLAQTGFKMAQLRDRVVVAEARHAELVLRAARLGSPERIERVAITELGMTYPAPSEVKYIVANVRQKTGATLAVNKPRFQLDGEAQAAGVAP